MRSSFLALAALVGILSGFQSVLAIDPPPPAIQTFTVSSNSQKTVTWTPYPAAQQYNLLSAGAVNGVFSNAPKGFVSGNQWFGTNTEPYRFYKLAVTPMSSNDLLTASVLNRLAYGPSPDDLELVTNIGPQAYIDQQLAPESVVEISGQPPVISYTNGAIASGAGTNWSSTTVTGTFSSSVLYIYLRDIGSTYVDNVQIHALVTTIVTNYVLTTNPTTLVITTNFAVSTNEFFSANLLTNGDFELPIPAVTNFAINSAGTSTNWTLSSNFVTSVETTAFASSGAQSLHVISTSPGTTKASAIWQQFTNPYVAFSRPATNINFPGTNQTLKCVLSYDQILDNNSSLLTVRLSGSGTEATGDDAPLPPGWIYATATGLANTTPQFYIFSSGSGEFYIDDIKLVHGTVAEAGANLLRNSDFEAPLSTNDWVFTSNFTASSISSQYSHSGAGSLKVVALAGGSGSGNAVYQPNIVGVTNSGTYTVSFWYLPSSRNRAVTTRLSGSLLVASPDTTASGLRRRLDDFNKPNYLSGSPNVTTMGTINLSDLQAWHLMNAVGAKRQLLEILLQFFENHFVTQENKSRDYLNRFYNDFNVYEAIATEWEYREVTKWRNALLRPDCTFYDLLKISAESPAMIVYLDSVDSKGNASNIANENYARELFELFTMGVDNGYEQNDIVAESRAWTGWSVDIVDARDFGNPFAPQTLQNGLYPGVGSTTVSNLVGIWDFNYKQTNHGTNRAPILSVWSTNSTSTNLIPLGPKVVPARFGAPWAGLPYQLTIPPRTGTNSIQDGYDVIHHLAFNVPMTAEYISVKLCRIFVHDNFPNPTTRTDLPEYAFYDYTNPNLTPEAKLVHDCMLTWWNSSPRGNIRAVLTTIFNSDLFRSHGGSMQKVKTPLEYCASAVRATRSLNPDGSATANTDGYSLASALVRMGSMSLFNRDAPDGYPEYGSAWISAGTLAERLRFIQSLLTSTSASPARPGDAGASVTDPVALLRKKIPGSMNNASAVADYFLGVLYPAEGKANLDIYRTSAINFLNTADNGTANAFSTLSTTSTTYDTRVRSMVSFLMTLQRFHEQ